jgi:ketosteroid isomerase-like protein
MKQRLDGFVGARCCSVCLLILILSAAVLFTGVSSAQNKKKKNSDTSNPAAPAPPLPAADQIERNIGRMLVAFQFGDADEMHKYYSDSATFVRSGAYEAPIVGWASYAEEYKRSWPAFQGMQITRRNTIIFTRPDVSWATYQWEFNSTMNGKPFTANGQTTLVFNKVGDGWVIVHNHTSQICPAATTTPAQVPAGTVLPPASKPPGL